MYFAHIHTYTHRPIYSRCARARAALSLLFCCSILYIGVVFRFSFTLLMVIIGFGHNEKKIKITNRYPPTFISIGISEQQFQSWCLKGLLYYYCGCGIVPLFSMLYLCACHLIRHTTQFLGGQATYICCWSFSFPSLISNWENSTMHEMTIRLFLY